MFCCVLYFRREKEPAEWGYHDRTYLVEHFSEQAQVQMRAVEAYQHEQREKGNEEKVDTTRHDLVMSCVIAKTVIIGTTRNNDGNNKSDTERNFLRQTFAALTGKKSTTKPSQEKSPEDNTDLFDDEIEGDNGDTSERKGSISLNKTKYRQSTKDISNSLKNLFGSSSSSKELYTTKSCFICLEPYKVGDNIFYSKNEKCCHSYHETCMMRWLMDHDDCPLCRNNYLNIADSVNA